MTKELITPWRRIVLPAFGAPFSLRSIQNAAMMAAHSPDCDVRLIYILEIPRSFALHSTMPDEEGHAQTVLADGVEEARRWRLDATTEVLRVRHPVEGLAAYVDQNDIDLIILGARPDEVRGLPRELMEELFERAPCEIILDYIANEQ